MSQTDTLVFFHAPNTRSSGTRILLEELSAPHELRVVNMKAGDVMFFNGSVIHGSYPNTSRDRFRRAFICHYVPRSTAELSKWYRAPMSFDGAVHASGTSDQSFAR